jgi:hypothetical protein
MSDNPSDIEQHPPQDQLPSGTAATRVNAPGISVSRQYPNSAAVISPRIRLRGVTTQSVSVNGGAATAVLTRLPG